MQKLLGMITRPPVPLVVGTLVSVLVVYFGSALLRTYMRSWFGWLTPGVATVLCVAVVLAVVAFVVIRSMKARAQARSIEQEIRAQGKVQMDALPPSSRSELEELQQRFDEALESLQSSKLGKGALYAFPWYVIIGPPGSGKTTAITESGLNFPFLKGQSQGRGIRGLGGTRNCDWWFTDQSILLDTAGRYTTQAEDRDEWISFLGMIKRSRKRKPINGVVVAIAITDILQANPEGIEKHAVTIRERIDELVRELEVVFPVYLVFTKCDLLDGFVESFGTMSKDERAQVWGATFTKDADDDRKTVARFNEEVGLLCRRLDEERLRRLVPDQPSETQRKILSLTLQLRSAVQPLRDFVGKLTEPNPFSDASELRGVYFTSGTQEGAPIDFVMRQMSAALGLDASTQATPMMDSESKSYFLRDMFSEVLYADRDLAHSSSGALRRQELGRAATIYGAAAAAVFGVVMFFLGWSDTRGLLADFEAVASEEIAIPLDRPGAPSDEAARVLNDKRDRYMALQDAYVFAPFAPGRDAVASAMADYAVGVRRAFLEPIRDYAHKRLRSFVDSQAPATDDEQAFREYAQLITVYQALGTSFGEAGSVEPVLPGELQAALTGRTLWTWDTSLIGKPRQTSSDSQEARHLNAYLAAREFDEANWGVLSIDRQLLGDAVALQNRSNAPIQIIKRAIEEQDLKGVPPEQARARIQEELEKQTGRPAEVDEDEIRRLQVQQNLKQLAGLSLQDAASLPGVLKSLKDLSDEVNLGQLNQALANLRTCGALPGAEILGDPVKDAYVAALKVIEKFREPMEQLVLNRASGDFLLRQVMAGTPDWLRAFGGQWTQAQVEIQQELVLMKDQLKGVSELNEDQIVQPVRASLMSMMDGIAEAVARELRDAIKNHWEAEVGLKLRVAIEKFPFRAAEVGEVSLSEFQDLFAREGRLAREREVVRAAQQAWPVAGKLDLSADFEMFLSRVEDIRTGCFAGDDPPALRFRVNGFPSVSGLVRDVTLRISDSEQGPTEVSTRDGTDEMISGPERQWRIGGKGAQLIIETKVGRLTVPESGEAGSAWSLLRLLRGGRPQPMSETVLVTWQVQYRDSDGDKKDLEASVEFAVVGPKLSLSPDFFELALPGSLFAADRK